MITHDVDESVLLSDRIVMMTNGPAATIGEVLHVDLPRPRDRVALAGNAQYNHYRQSVLHFLYAKMRGGAMGERTSTRMTAREIASVPAS